MSSFDPPPRFDKEPPAATPFLVRRPIKKQQSLLKQLVGVVKQRPLFIAFILLGLLGLAGWIFVPSLSSINATLHSMAQARPAESPVTTPSVVKSSPIPASSKPAVAVSASPVLTPSPTPKPTPTPLPTTSPTVTPPVTAGKGNFAVQIGAYQDQAEAASHLARIKSLGMDARMIAVTIPNKGGWHRVQVGRFETRDAATRFGQQLQAQKAVSVFMVTEYQAR